MRAVSWAQSVNTCWLGGLAIRRGPKMLNKKARSLWVWCGVLFKSTKPGSRELTFLKGRADGVANAWPRGSGELHWATRAGRSSCPVWGIATCRSPTQPTQPTFQAPLECDGEGLRTDNSLTSPTHSRPAGCCPQTSDTSRNSFPEDMLHLGNRGLPKVSHIIWRLVL